MENEHGTVELVPYVGDSDIAQATCKHGDYTRLFKGAPLRHAEKALAEHYAAKHSEED